LYRGRNLPPWDADTGALDAYAKITLGSQTLISSVKPNSRNPAWYESFQFTTPLPPDRSRRPEVVMQIWDRDEGIGESDDFVGNIILRLNEDDGETPTWRKVFYQEEGDIKCGEILVGVGVVDEGTRTVNSPEGSMVVSEDDDEEWGENADGGTNVSSSGAAVASLPAKVVPIQTKNKPATIDIVALSCRNLKSSGSFYSLSKPYAELHIAGKTFKTNPSSKPYPAHCNFSQPLTITDVMLPEDYEEAPFLDVTVYDKKTVGKVLLGTGSFWLGDTEHYKEVRSRKRGRSWIGGRREGVDEDDGDGDSCCSSNHKDSNEWVGHAPYMKNRESLLGDLKCKPIYSVIPLYRGKKTSSKKTTQKYELEEIGQFNIFAKISFKENKRGNPRTESIVRAMQMKQKFRVRVYCLDAMDLTAKDGKTSDPFLRVSLGSSKFDSAKHIKTLKPEFYERFDMVCKVPGDSMLKVDVWDYDRFGSNDLIGSTAIDLESRWFSKDWRAIAVKPLESRDLKIGSSTQTQGQLKLWVDMVPIQEEKKLEKFDITPPPPHEFDIRAVVWKSEDLPSGGDFSGQADYYVKLR